MYTSLQIITIKLTGKFYVLAINYLNLKLFIISILFHLCVEILTSICIVAGVWKMYYVRGVANITFFYWVSKNLKILVNIWFLHIQDQTNEDKICFAGYSHNSHWKYVLNWNKRLITDTMSYYHYTTTIAFNLPVLLLLPDKSYRWRKKLDWTRSTKKG